MGLQADGGGVSADGAAPAPVTGLAAALQKSRAGAVFDVDAPKPEPAKPKTVEIKADDAMVRRMSALEGQALADKARIATLETTAKQGEALVRVKELYKAGKRTEAIALLSEADPTAEMEAILEEHLSRPTEETEAALAQRVDKLQEQVEADAKARKDAEDARVATEAKRVETEAQANTQAFALNALDTALNDDGTPKFELCARPKNRDGAAKLAIEHAVALAVKRGLDVESLTPDTSRALLQDAYADVEMEIEAEGVERLKEIEERYKRVPKAIPARAAQPSPQVVVPPGNGADRGQQTGQQTSRPQPTPKVGLAIEKPKPAHTLDAVLAKNAERARY